MKFRSAFFGAAAMCLALACSKPSKKEDEVSFMNPEGFSLSETKSFQIKADWAEPLLSGGEGTNEVTLTFLTGTGAQPESVELQEFHPRMPGMGNHGTDEETQLFTPVEGEPSKVKVTGIYFNMPGGDGEWVVTVTAVVAGAKDDVKIAAPAVK